MALRMYHPGRGDIVHLNFDPQRGREMWGLHFGVVLSPLSYNRRTGLAIIVPATSKFHREFDAWMLPVPSGVIDEKGRPFTGWIYTDQIKSFDYRERDTQFCGRMPDQFTATLLHYACSLLDVKQT